MAAKAGVWIDYKQAVVVLLSDAGQEIKKVAFNIGQQIHSKGGARHEFVAENRLERKVHSDRKDYYEDVIAAIGAVKSLLILGPGEAKGEFTKHMKGKKLRGLTIELETADKMTDRQIAAQVREHFTKDSAGKTIASKKTATKKPAIVNPRRVAKKTK